MARIAVKSPTGYDEVLAAAVAGAGVGPGGVPAFSPSLSDNVAFRAWLSAAAIGDGSAGYNMATVGLWLFNGTLWDRLKTANVFDPFHTSGLLGAGALHVDNNNGSTGSLAPLTVFRARVVSALNATNVVTADLRQLSTVLDIVMVASAGTATLLVEVSSDNVNWITVDSIIAAASTVKHYNNTTVGVTNAISPLAFRFVRITAGAAGVGNTTTLTIGAK